MSISYTEERTAGLKKALIQAKKAGHSILYSEVKQIKWMDPLSFYRAGRERYEGERLFWQDSAKETAIAGIGRAIILQADAGPSRYQDIENRWNKLLENAAKTGIQNVPVTGPLLFGGFSFDYNKSRSRLWERFGDNLFYVPACLLTAADNKGFLTINVLCSPEDREEDVIAKINEWDTLLEVTKEKLPENSMISQTEVHPKEWMETVAQTVDELKHSDDLDKIVLARELRVVFKDRLLSEAVLERLLEEQPGSYIFSLESEGDCFIGATPERLVKKEGQDLYSACLAGSIGRGRTESEDKGFGNELLHDEKNRTEHQYVVSMITEALRPVCSSLHVPNEPQLMKNRHIQHLFTPVHGICRSGASVLEVVERLHPTPAMGGLPKEKAVGRIREIEELERGFYAGPIGWMDSYQNGEFAVGIRSGLLQGREASLFAGCGIVEDSVPESEYRETAIKFSPMLSALGGTLHE